MVSALEIIGDAAAFLSAVAIIPLVWKATKSKTAEGITFLFLGIALLSKLLWLYYGSKKKVSPIIMYSIFLICAYLYLIGLKIYYERKKVKAEEEK